jgi:hypothetical protein
MIEELWAKMRGVDKWPETTATVTSVDRTLAKGRSPAHATITFNYRSSDGVMQSGSYYVGDQSSLYDLDEDQSFSVRYNPKHPNHYFSYEYTIPFWWKFYGVVIGVFALVFLYIFVTLR